MESWRCADFDSLTRALAVSTSRRQTLRIFAGTIAGSALAVLGVGCQKSPNPGPSSSSPTPTPGSSGSSSAEPSSSGSSSAEPSSSASPSSQTTAVPATRCSNDPATSASLQAAAAAVASGATQVDLSPAGCYQYARTIVDGVVTDEHVTVDGTPILAWTHTATHSAGTRDGDLDGFDEWTATITRDAAGDPQTVEVVEYDGVSHSVLSRTVRTITGPTTMRVVIETTTDGSTNTLTFDSPRLQSTNWDGPPPRAALVNTAGVHRIVGPCGVQANGNCPPGTLDQATAALFGGVAEGVSCLQRLGLLAESIDAMSNAVKVDIVCASNLGRDGLSPSSSCTDTPSGRPTIYVSPERFGLATLQQRRNIMFHEILHTVLGPHDPALDNGSPDPIFSENDRVKACNSLCNNPGATRCDCATCLRQKECKPPCDSLKECATKGDSGAICPCPKRYKYYTTVSECAADCPRGTACFGYQCRPLVNPCS